MPPAIIVAAISIGASAAAAAGLISATIAMVIVIGASVAAAFLIKPSVPSIGAFTSQQERKQVLRSATAPSVFIYGATVVSGLLFFAEEESGDQEKEWLHLGIAIAGHPIDRVGRVWLGDDLISTYANLAEVEIHSNRTAPDAFMLLKCQSWKSDMIGKGITWARVSLKFDAEKFPSGVPNIKFEVFGKRVYDPRSQTTVWSDNPALCILDFYRNYLKVPDTDINFNQFVQAANVCDQTVSDGGGPRKRYTLNGTFDASETQAGILDDLHLACAGEPTYMAGQHGILAGAYYGPATMDIYPDQIISDIKIVPEAAYNDKINIVTGTFLDPVSLYTEVDFPPVKVQSYIDSDGGEYTSDMKLRFVSNEFQAQQLAQIKINRTRIGRILSFTMNLSGYQYRPGYYVHLYLPMLGINGEEFRITEWSMSADKGVDIVLKQETSQVWADIIGSPIERPDITDFPVASVAPPINLIYTLTEIGEVVQGILSWTNIGADVSYNIVVIRQNGIALQTIQVPGQNVNITGLPRGTYDLSVMAVNYLGQRSVESMTTIEIRAPSKPTSCEVIQQFFGFTLKPRSGDIYTVSTQYDFWTSGETPLSSSATANVEQFATRKGIGNSMSDSGLQNGHVYYWYIRAINAFGSSEFLEVAATCQTDTSNLVDIIDSSIKDSPAFQGVQEGVNTSLEAIMQEANGLNTTVDHQWSQYGEVKADIIVVKETVTTAEKGLSSLNTYVQAQIGPNGSLVAAVNQKMTAEVNIDGTASASFITNVGIVRDGVKYSAGMGMSISPDGSSYKSTMVFNADQFGIYTGSDPTKWQAAFFVYQGQVFIKSAMIQDASIDFAKITDTLQSINFLAGVSGWNLPKNGNAEFNNVTVRGALYATAGNFNLSGVGNKVVIDGNGITVNLTGGGMVRVGSW